MTVSPTFTFEHGLLPSQRERARQVFIGDIFCCINIDTERVELYQDSILLGSYGAAYAKTLATDIRTNPNMYLIEMGNATTV